MSMDYFSIANDYHILSRLWFWNNILFIICVAYKLTDYDVERIVE